MNDLKKKKEKKNLFIPVSDNFWIQWNICIWINISFLNITTSSLYTEDLKKEKKGKTKYIYFIKTTIHIILQKTLNK